MTPTTIDTRPVPGFHFAFNRPFSTLGRPVACGPSSRAFSQCERLDARFGYLRDTRRSMVETSLPGSVAIEATASPSGETNIPNDGPPSTESVPVHSNRMLWTTKRPLRVGRDANQHRCFSLRQRDPDLRLNHGDDTSQLTARRRSVPRPDGVDQRQQERARMQEVERDVHCERPG